MAVEGGEASLKVCRIARMLHDLENRHPLAFDGKYSVDETPRQQRGSWACSSFPLRTKDMSARVRRKQEVGRTRTTFVNGI